MPASGLSLVQDLLVATMDGEDPSAWVVWGTPFTQLRDECGRLSVSVPPEYDWLPKYRFRLLTDSPPDLLTRSTWSAVVGTFVDLVTPRPDLREMHRRICGRIANAQAPSFKDVGYHLIAALPGVQTPPAVLDTFNDLATDARRILGHPFVCDTAALSRETFQWALSHRAYSVILNRLQNQTS